MEVSSRQPVHASPLRAAEQPMTDKSAPSLQELLRCDAQAAMRQKEPDQKISSKGKAESSGLAEDQARPVLGIIWCKQGLPG